MDLSKNKMTLSALHCVAQTKGNDMNQLKEMLEAYRNGERGLPTYDEMQSVVETQEMPDQTFDASKGVYWFSILLKCSALLNVPEDEPIPSGVLKAVQELTKKQDDAKLAGGLPTMAEMPAVQFPNLVDPNYGALFDTFKVQQYAMKYARKCFEQAKIESSK